MVNDGSYLWQLRVDIHSREDQIVLFAFILKVINLICKFKLKNIVIILY